MRTHLDLCSGIGGFALAARWLGMKTIGFCEIDPFCQRVLAKNFPGVPIHDDLTTLRSNDVREWVSRAEQGIWNDGWIAADAETVQRSPFERGKPDRTSDERGTVGLITGGYPCQPFSLAGKRLGAEDDRHLWPYIAALVAELRPRYCLFENVAGHITLGLDRVLADLEALGYTCRPVVVPACALNAPHRRDRVWLMAHAESIGEREPADKTNTIATGRHAWSIAGSGSQPALADAADGGVRRGSAPGQSGFAALRGEVVADSEGEHGRIVTIGGTAYSAVPRISGPGVGVAPNADRTGRRKQRWAVTVEAKHAAIECRRRGKAESGLGVSHDGIPGLLDGQLARPWDTDWEYGVPRVSDGCTDRVNKLKALGNAIVPQVAYVLMAAMTQMEA